MSCRLPSLARALSTLPVVTAAVRLEQIALNPSLFAFVVFGLGLVAPGFLVLAFGSSAFGISAFPVAGLFLLVSVVSLFGLLEERTLLLSLGAYLVGFALLVVASSSALSTGLGC